MDIFIGILTAVEVIVCLLLILVVLMQRPRQEGLGASFGDAAASQVWGAQTTNVLQKFTVYLAIVLFGLTLLLAVLVSRTHNGGGKSEKIFGDAAPAAATPAAPSAAMPVPAPEATKTEEKKSADSTKADTAPKADEKKAAAAPATEGDKAAPAPKVEPAKAPAEQPK